MNSKDIITHTVALLNQPSHNTGLTVSALISLLQAEDSSVTRGQVLNLLTKAKWGKIKNIGVALSPEGKQLVIKASAFHHFMVDYNASYELLAKQARLIENQLNEDQHKAVDEAMTAMQSLYSRHYVDVG